MRKQNKKGFTIVELVIVIAVIAILVAVMVPTFVTLVRKAQISNDRQLVKNLNTALQTESQSKEAPKTMQGALDIAAEYGYDVAKINAKASDNEILWDSKNNVYCYFDKDGGIEYIPEAPKAKDAKDVDYWVISDTKSDKYSTYYTGTDATITTDKGFDAGTSGVTTVNYTTTADQTVTIRTNSPLAVLTVNAGASTVHHYGNAKAVNITAVASNSYHENGQITALNVKKGKIEVNPTAYVGTLAIAKDAVENDVAIVNNGAIFATAAVVYTVANDVVTLGEYEEPAAESVAATVVKDVKEASTSDIFSIGTADALIGLAAAHQQGILAGELKIKLTANIDLTGRTWVPFGLTTSNPFMGEFDGNGKTISGLSYSSSIDGLVQAFSSESEEGTPFALIAYADKNVNIHDLTVEANIGMQNGEAVSAFVGVYNNLTTSTDTTVYELKFENCVAKGTITAEHKVAGFVGTGFITLNSEFANQLFNNQSHKRASVSTTFINCTNEATITATRSKTNAKVGGFAGGLALYGDGVLTVTGCTNKGNVTAMNTTNALGSFCGFKSTDNNIAWTNALSSGFEDSKNVGPVYGGIKNDFKCFIALELFVAFIKLCG